MSNAVLDGEVVCLDHEGRPVFSALPRRGVSLFTEVVQRDLEGIVATKLRQAPYDLVDRRSPWVKIKNREYSQAVGRAVRRV